MRCKKGQALWEITIFLAVVCAIAGGVFFYIIRQDAKKQTETNTFKDQAQQHQQVETNNYYALFNFLPWSWQGCGLPKKEPQNELSTPYTKIGH